ncbi:MAG: zinc-finger domain-containing protein [Xanthomonadales bacterium]|nr:zinc-finger domain-containing protein [Xanthomonadales bacterium]
MSANVSRSANSERTYAVKRADLPVSCPAPDMPLWNSHPRVYLPLEDQPEARCMYCGALYQRVD